MVGIVGKVFGVLGSIFLGNIFELRGRELCVISIYRGLGFRRRFLYIILCIYLMFFELILLCLY